MPSLIIGAHYLDRNRLCECFLNSLHSDEELHPITVDHVFKEDYVSPANLSVGVPALCLELVPALRAEWPRLHVAILSRGAACAQRGSRGEDIDSNGLLTLARFCPHASDLIRFSALQELLFPLYPLSALLKFPCAPFKVEAVRLVYGTHKCHSNWICSTGNPKQLSRPRQHQRSQWSNGGYECRHRYNGAASKTACRREHLFQRPRHSRYAQRLCPGHPAETRRSIPTPPELQHRQRIPGALFQHHRYPQHRSRILQATTMPLGSNNIYINNEGDAADSNTIRIGIVTPTTNYPNAHTQTFIAGIANATVSGSTVCHRQQRPAWNRNLLKSIQGGHSGHG